MQMQMGLRLLFDFILISVRKSASTIITMCCRVAQMRVGALEAWSS